MNDRMRSSLLDLYRMHRIFGEQAAQEGSYDHMALAELESLGHARKVESELTNEVVYVMDGKLLDELCNTILMDEAELLEEVRSIYSSIKEDSPSWRNAVDLRMIDYIKNKL